MTSGGSPNDNLLAETLKTLQSAGKATADVRWVGSRDGLFAMAWDDFAKIADVDYDGGYGSPEVAQDLVVVGEGWWLERHEYDGAEGWSFQTSPIRGDNPKSFTRAVLPFETGWKDLVELNTPETQSAHEDKK